MKYETMDEIVLAARTVREGCDVGAIRYPVMFKKALCEYLAKGEVTKNAVYLKSGIKLQTINKWVRQHNEGLLTLEGAYSVSTKAKTINNTLLKQLQKDAVDIQVKIDLILKCEALGLVVS